MSTKTSIKIKKFWWAYPESNGGAGTSRTEIEVGQREATVKFNGSDADVENYKNVLGNDLESAKTKGDSTLNFQFADLTPSEQAPFIAGTVTAGSEGDYLEPPDNENQAIEMSLFFLTDKNIFMEVPRASIDSYPMFDDDDLHYFQINSVLLKPELASAKKWKMTELNDPTANDILTFTMAEESGAATIDDVAHTVDIEVVIATPVIALVPTIGVSLGAGLSPISGVAADFTNPVEYTVTSADGVAQVWTVTVTVAV